jgi:3',5'-cyclic AMP phosphodiesterase CpdA
VTNLADPAITPLRLYITADLHWGHARGQEQTRSLAGFVREDPPDVLVIAGDVGSGPNFAECLELFRHIPCQKAVVPGNHDIWVPTEETEIDSQMMYEVVLPRAAAEYGFHYLDTGPLILPLSDLALVGTINWYDYSWAIDQMRERYPDELDRLKTKLFSRGRYNDVRFVRWSLDDVSFTARVVKAFAANLDEALSHVGKAIVITHHPAFYGISFPRDAPPADLDHFLWDAFGGNRSIEEVLRARADRIPFAFSGHTHRAIRGTLDGIAGYNIGSDYPFKRLLCLDWPAGSISEKVFE